MLLRRLNRATLESNRGSMSRDQMIASAERIISFYLAQMNEPTWPTIESKLSLIDQSRENLRRVSPVAYLADKAASWGDMPLHAWLSTVIKDPSALSQMEELLGIGMARNVTPNIDE